MSLLELEHISKTYHARRTMFGPLTETKAVEDFSFSISEGESVALVGESGCGKTTVARIGMRLVFPDAGTVLYQGRPLARRDRSAPSDFRRDIQMVFQDPYSSLDPRWNVRQILKEALTLFPNEKEKREDDYLKTVLNEVGLPVDVLSRFPHEFSGGERQRIAIARALMTKPKLLICDEAVSSLDVIIQKQILDVLLSLKARRTLSYLFISHNLRLVRRFCQRTAVMRAGRIVEMAATEDLFRNPLHPYTRQLLSASLHYKVC
jgi:ABC-type oligopeptide transport system ATPase subunit